MKLDLPEDRELLLWLRRHGLRIERGKRPSLELYRARQRRLGRGEKVGVRDRGRISDLRIVEAAIRNKALFRQIQVTPYREVLLLVDLRGLDGSHLTRRLLSAAVVAGGTVLAMPSTALTIHTLGSYSHVTPLRLTGLAGLRLLWKSLEGFAYLEPEPRLAPGRVRLACYSDPYAHALFVSHYLPERLFERLSLPGGGTVVLVTPPKGMLTNVFGDSVGFGAFEDADAPAEACLIKYKRLSVALGARRIQVLSMPDRGTVLEAFEKALGEARSTRSTPWKASKPS
jgi:hypothetical protein